jgi:malonate-semialdehyde dehydrogenase (acetylating)/methylmalonate-semialdehyde dehydrogenase
MVPLSLLKIDSYTEKFIQEADVGMVGVNVGNCAPYPYLPFGGIKGSLIGNNKVQGKDVMDFFTQNKVAKMRLVDPAIGEVNYTNKGDSVPSSVADYLPMTREFRGTLPL